MTDTMLTLDAIVARLQRMKIKIIADETGMCYDTIRRITYGYFKNPSYTTVKALSDYLLKAGPYDK